VWAAPPQIEGPGACIPCRHYRRLFGGRHGDALDMAKDQFVCNAQKLAYIVGTNVRNSLLTPETAEWYYSTNGEMHVLVPSNSKTDV
jgi:hypothetical protein